jgi:hypothetical protein
MVNFEPSWCLKLNFLTSLQNFAQQPKKKKKHINEIGGSGGY